MEFIAALSKHAVKLLNVHDLSPHMTYSFNLPDRKDPNTKMIMDSCNHLMASSFGPFVFVHHLAREQPLFRSIISNPLTAISFAGDGIYLFGGDDKGAISVWDLSSGELLRKTKSHFQRVTNIKSSDEWIISSSTDDFVDASIDITQPLYSLNDHARSVDELVLFKAGKRFLSRSKDKTIKIFDIENCNGALFSFIFSSAPTSVAINPQENIMFVGLDNGNLLQIDYAKAMLADESVVKFIDGNDEQTRKCDAKAVKLCFSCDGNSLYSLHLDGEVAMWNVANFQPLKKAHKTQKDYEAYHNLDVVRKPDISTFDAKNVQVCAISKNLFSSDSCVPNLVVIDELLGSDEPTMKNSNKSNYSEGDSRKIFELKRFAEQLYALNENLINENIITYGQYEKKDSPMTDVYIHHASRLVHMHNRAVDKTTAIKLNRMISIIDDAFKELGVWCAASLAEAFATTAYENLDNSCNVNNNVVFQNAFDSVPEMQVFKEEEEDQKVSQNASGKLSCSYREDASVKHPSVPTTFEMDDLSSKIHKLLRHIKKTKDDVEKHWKCILFAEKNSTVKVLQDILSQPQFEINVVTLPLNNTDVTTIESGMILCTFADSEKLVKQGKEMVCDFSSLIVFDMPKSPLLLNRSIEFAMGSNAKYFIFVASNSLDKLKNITENISSICAARMSLVEPEQTQSRKRKYDEIEFDESGVDSTVYVPNYIPLQLRTNEKWKQYYPNFTCAQDIDVVFSWLKAFRKDFSVYPSLHSHAISSSTSTSDDIVRSFANTIIYINLPSRKDVFSLLTIDKLPQLPDFMIYSEMGDATVSFRCGPPINLDWQRWQLCRDFHLKIFGIFMSKPQDKYTKEGQVNNICAEKDIFTEDQRIYKLLPVKTSDETVDWEYVKRVVEFEFTQTLSKEVDIENGIAFTPYNDRKYFTLSWRSDLNPTSLLTMDDSGSMTYAEYYEKTHEISLKCLDSPLIEATHAHPWRNLIKPRRKGLKSDSDTLFLVPELSVLLPITQSDVSVINLLPTILFKVEAFLICDNLLNHLNLKRMSILHIYPACCAPIFREVCNYERYETLGDSFLKFATSSFLFRKYPTSNEGKLSSKRVRIVSNKYLFEVATNHDLPKYLLACQFFPRQWAPCEIKPWRPRRKSDITVRRDMKELSMKMIADFVEAIIGATVHCLGVAEGTRLLEKLGCIEPVNYVPPPETTEVSPKLLTLVHELETILEYKFVDKRLLLRSVTHISASETGQDYQLLEYLGDAVIDWLVMRYLFDKFPLVESGPLTEFRQLTVNNGSFGRIMVENKLHQLIQFNSVSMASDINEFVVWYDDHYDVSPNEIEVEGPKILGDVFESLTGAVFVDTGFNVDHTWKIISPFLAPFMDKHCTIEALDSHPVRKLYETAHKKGYNTEDVEMRTDEDSNGYVCNVFIKGVFLLQTTGTSKNATKRKAAIKAIELL